MNSFEGFFNHSLFKLQVFSKGNVNHMSMKNEGWVLRSQPNASVKITDVEMVTPEPKL